MKKALHLADDLSLPLDFVSRTAGILAVLEPGPAPLAVIAGWLHADPRIVRHALRGLRAEGHVKRVGTDQRWALATFTARPGAPPIFPGRDWEAEVLALLAAGPMASRRIGAAVGRSDTSILKVLHRLEARHAIKRVGRSGQLRWALPSYEPPPKPQRPVAGPLTTPRRTSQTVTAGGSWWVAHAAPDAWEPFGVAAHARDVALIHDPVWRRPVAPASIKAAGMRLPPKGLF